MYPPFPPMFLISFIIQIMDIRFILQQTIKGFMVDISVSVSYVLQSTNMTFKYDDKMLRGITSQYDAEFDIYDTYRTLF